MEQAGIRPYLGHPVEFVEAGGRLAAGEQRAELLCHGRGEKVGHSRCKAISCLRAGFFEFFTSLCMAIFSLLHELRVAAWLGKLL